MLYYNRIDLSKGIHVAESNDCHDLIAIIAMCYVLI